MNLDDNGGGNIEEIRESRGKVDSVYIDKNNIWG